MEIEPRHYQELACRIIELACADYIDALIIKRQGYISEEQLKKKIYTMVLDYGKKRYVFKSRHGLTTQKNTINLNKCRAISKMLQGKDVIAKAEYDIRQTEEYFHSPQFAIYMPNTDADGLIHLLKRKALRGERMSVGYPSIY